MGEASFFTYFRITDAQWLAVLRAACTRVPGVTAEEILSDVFVYFEERFREKPDTLKNKDQAHVLKLVWIYARQQGVRHVRKNRRSQGQPADLGQVADGDPRSRSPDRRPTHETFEHCDEADRLLRQAGAMKLLDVVRLRCMKEKFLVIAEKLGLSPSTVTRRLNEAKALLKELAGELSEAEGQR